MIRKEENRYIVRIALQTDAMVAGHKEPMDFNVFFVPSDGAFRFYNDLTRSDFEAFCKANHQSLSSDTSTLTNLLYGKALQELRWSTDPAYQEIRDWATRVLDKASDIHQALELNEFQEIEVRISESHTIRITPCSQSTESIRDLADVEWFLTDDFLVDGGSCIYKLAADLLNYRGLEKAQIDEEEKLQRFYEDHIAAFYDTPQREWTDKQHEDFGFFSDWHKDVYGHRPHPGRNECQNRLDEEEKDL